MKNTRKKTMKLKLETYLASKSAGRIILHLVTMLIGGHIAFHIAGIVREF